METYKKKGKGKGENCIKFHTTHLLGILNQIKNLKHNIYLVLLRVLSRLGTAALTGAGCARPSPSLPALIIFMALGRENEVY